VQQTALARLKRALLRAVRPVIGKLAVQVIIGVLRRPVRGAALAEVSPAHLQTTFAK
jgi:hypothetical protein